MDGGGIADQGGEIAGRGRPRRHRAVEFKKFLARLDKEVPAG
ncbi:hypothetical protein [Streptomyces nigrescens]|uniref:Transposase n=1 Tax=Streptomyces nigrescens TaxID=1920 RepID=A0ABY7ITF8_STRNI|nr:MULTISPECIES: hypothetical protein [Streptomyces]MCX5450755.1 hypothetical protein [Streptomyces libani]WAU02159.1 hypothetical protein STRNI_000130 [Streptomyces nigrescens]